MCESPPTWQQTKPEASSCALRIRYWSVGSKSALLLQKLIQLYFAYTAWSITEGACYRQCVILDDPNSVFPITKPQIGHFSLCFSVFFGRARLSPQFTSAGMAKVLSTLRKPEIEKWHRGCFERGLRWRCLAGWLGHIFPHPGVSRKDTCACSSVAVMQRGYMKFVRRMQNYQTSNHSAFSLFYTDMAGTVVKRSISLSARCIPDQPYRANRSEDGHHYYQPIGVWAHGLGG